MHRRHFLQGLGAAIASLFVWGRGRAEADKPVQAGRKSVLTVDNHGLVYATDELIQDGTTGLETYTLAATMDDFARSVENKILYGVKGRPPTLTTRTSHQVSAHASFMRDEARIAAQYDVQGTDKGLVVTSWVSHSLADDEAVVKGLLAMMDEDAEWAAAHPDHIPTAGVLWT